MPSLQVRELPAHIYHKLQSKAQKEHRSFSQQAIVALAKGLDMEENPKNRRAALLKNILDDPIIMNSQAITSPVDLIRKDRQR
ncbi:MAG: hypothetical protein ACKVE4_12280 [Dissulfuribacterales bacterium]